MKGRIVARGRAPGRAVLIGAAVAALTVPASARPTAAQSTLRTELDTTVVTVGDRITLTLAVEHPVEATVEWPDSFTMAPFEVLDAAVTAPRIEGERATTSARLALTVFELGEVEIPALEVEVVGPDGTVEAFSSDRFAVEVVSVGADEGGDIREIRGPFAVPISALRLGLLLLLVLVPALLAWLLYRRWRPGPAEDSVERAPPPRHAHEIALEELAALERSPLLAEGRVKEFHIQLSEILRVYIERRFMVEALEMTSREILDGLERAGAGPRVRDPLRVFLGECDMVKFAKVRPDDATSLGTLRRGRALVEDTVPTVLVADVWEDAPPVDGAEGGVEASASAPGDASARGRPSTSAPPPPPGTPSTPRSPSTPGSASPSGSASAATGAGEP